MKKDKLFLIAVVVLCGLLITGLASACTLLEPEEKSPSPDETPTGVTGGTLNLYGIDPHTLDPAISGDGTSHQYVLQLFSGLVSLDADLEVIPDIAEDWEITDGGRRYTFELRRGVKFHDGKEVKAGDFKFSWERAANPETGSRTAASYLGDIVGIEDVLSGRSLEASGIKVIDDYTLEVNIDAPKGYFLSKMSYPTAFVVDRENVNDGSDWWHEPNGTGPFSLAEWEETDRLVLERNELFYGEKALLDSVEFTLFGGVPMNLYETGQIDVTNVSVFHIDRVMDREGGFFEELQTAPELSFFYIGFNSQRPPFDDINIRRAFSMALDKEKLASLVFRDMIEPAYGILPPGMPGFNKDLTGPGYDPVEARRLINESGYGSAANLPQITLTTIGRGGVIPGSLEAIIYEWRENLGVNVKVRQLQPERFFYNLKTEKDELFNIGWIADYPHPQDFLEILFRSDSDSNYAEYSNPEVDELLVKAGLETDYLKSIEMYRQAEQMLVDDAAALPLWFGRNFILVKSYVKGYELNPLGLVPLNKVWIDRE